MLISTKGRYALRVMAELALCYESCRYVPGKHLATSQDLSVKYLENIMTLLSKAGLIDAIHGRNGGFRLNRRPEEYSLYEILQLTEKTLAPAGCIELNGSPDNSCSRSSQCKTLPVWVELNDLITDFLHYRTIADLVQHS